MKKKGARRYSIKGKPGAWVRRNKLGQFVKWVSIGASLRADRRTKAKTTVKSGYGYKGDLKKRRTRRKKKR